MDSFFFTFLDKYSVNKFCCCIDLRRGVIGIAMIQTVISFTEIALYIPTGIASYNYKTETWPVIVFNLFLKLMGTVLGAVLILGSLEKKEKYLLWWIRISTIFLILSVGPFVWGAVVEKKQPMVITSLVIIPIFSVLLGYCILVVNSYRNDFMRTDKNEYYAIEEISATSTHL